MIRFSQKVAPLSLKLDRTLKVYLGIKPHKTSVIQQQSKLESEEGALSSRPIRVLSDIGSAPYKELKDAEASRRSGNLQYPHKDDDQITSGVFKYHKSSVELPHLVKDSQHIHNAYSEVFSGVRRSEALSNKLNSKDNHLYSPPTERKAALFKKSEARNEGQRTMRNQATFSSSYESADITSWDHQKDSQLYAMRPYQVSMDSTLEPIELSLNKKKVEGVKKSTRIAQ